MRWWAGVAIAALGASCAAEVEDTAGGGGAGAGASAGGDTFGGAGEGGAACQCQPGLHETNIVVLTDEGSLWRFDPKTQELAFVRDLPCAIAHPYSMAIDERGRAWVLDADSKDLVTVELAGDGDCGDPGYDPGPLQSGFELFGMAFTTRPESLCGDLYAHSYSGDGPFDEGPSAGVLGRLDAETHRFELLAAVDYDGGELAGTGSGRLFAFAGNDPVKLVEYDPADGSTLSTRALEGLSKTQASAFALYGSDVYFFTEAPPVACDGCLERQCGAAFAACRADEACSQQLACALEVGRIDDDCGGGMPAELQQCVAMDCLVECLPDVSDRKSQVTKLALGSPDAELELVVPIAPIRIVGAGTSICAPAVPQ